MMGVENFHYKFDRDTPPFASEEAACHLSSQMEVGFRILWKRPKIALWEHFMLDCVSVILSDRQINRIPLAIWI